MARKYLFFEGPEGLLNFELVTLLGFLLVDSNFRNQLMGEKEEGAKGSAKDAVERFLDQGISKANGGDQTDQSGQRLMLHWGNIILEDKAAKATIDDLLIWAEANKNILDCLTESLKKYLNKQHPPSEDPLVDNYSQCDFKAADVIELLESARLMSWRQVLK